MEQRLTKQQLRERWASVVPQYLSPPRRWGRHGQRSEFDFAGLVAAAPFGGIEERVDIRCLDLTDHFVWMPAASIGGVDMSDVRFDNASFEEQSWTDVVLARAHVTNCSFVDAEFARVIFRRAQLGGSFLGSRSERGSSRYIDCVFTKSRTSALSLGRSDFVGCTFDSLAGRIEPGTATFDDCRFIGRLHDFEFRTGWPTNYRRKERRGAAPVNTMRGVDLSEASLSYVTFHDLDLSSIKLDPSRQLLINDWPAIRSHITEIPQAVADEKANILWNFDHWGTPIVADLEWIESEFVPGSADLIRRAASWA